MAHSARHSRLAALDREIGGDPEVEGLIEDAVSEFPTRPVFRCALAYVYSSNEDTGRAQATINDLAAEDFAGIQRDNEYLFSLSFLADAVHALTDVRAAAILYDLLAPYARLNAINADEIATGSVSRSLGVLAAAMSRWNDGLRHFETAVLHNTELGSRPWVAHSRHDYGRMLAKRDTAGDAERAEKLLSVAREEYEAMGMEPWASQIVGP